MKYSISILMASLFLLIGCEPENLTVDNKSLVIVASDFEKNGVTIPNFSIDKEIITKDVNFDQTYSINYDYEDDAPILIHQTVVVDKSDFTASLLHNLAWEITLKVIEEKGCNFEDCNYEFDYGQDIVVYKILDEDGIQIGTAMKIEYELVKYSMLMFGINIDTKEKIDSLIKDKVILYDELSKKKQGIFG